MRGNLDRSAIDDELTILLGLKDRIPFTRRWMSYADSVRLPFKIFIADGGSDDSAQNLLSDRSAFPNLAYEYVRYEYNRTYTDFWTRLAHALSCIQTPFVALADNDDFFVVPGVQEAIHFLRSHPDYATCGGQCAVFWVRDSPGTRDERFLYGENVEWKCSLDAGSLTNESAKERIRHQSLRATHPSYYHVRRTESLRQHAEIIRDIDLADTFLIERLLFFLSAIAGKTKQLETLFIARQWNAPDRSGLAHEAKYGDWLGRMLVPTWSQDFTRFVNSTSTSLAARDGLTLDEAQRSVTELYRLWLAPQMLGDVVAEPTVTPSMAIVVSLVRRLLERSPDSRVRRFARMLYRRIRWISVDAVHGTQLRSRRVLNVDEEFRQIQRFLTSPPRPSS